MCFVVNLREISSPNGLANKKWMNSGSDNGLSTKTCHVIIRPSDDLIFWQIYASIHIDVLIQKLISCCLVTIFLLLRFFLNSYLVLLDISSSNSISRRTLKDMPEMYI